MADENNQIVMKKISDLDESTSLSTGSYTVVSKNGSSYKFDLSKIKADVDLTEIEEKLDGHTEQLEQHTEKLNELEAKVNTGGIGGVSREYVDGELDKKVDKVDGKGLSSNDFTNEHKIKLESLDLSTKADTGHKHEISDINGLLDDNGQEVYQRKTDLSLRGWTVANAITENYKDIVKLQTELDGKVDKVENMELISTEEKDKLANIADGAEVNVQSDWNEANENSDAFIKNKPKLELYATQAYVDEKIAQAGTGGTVDLSGYVTETELQDELNKKVNSADLKTVATSGSYTDLTNTPTIPTKTSELTNDSNFLTPTTIPAEYITETKLSGKGYLTEQSLVDLEYAKKSDIPTNHATQTELAQVSGKVAALETSNTTLTNDVATLKTTVEGIDATYAKKQELTDGLSAKVNSTDLKTVATTGSYNDLIDTPTIPTTVAQLTDSDTYAKVSNIPTKVSDLTNDSHYVTDTELTAKGYLTQHQSLDGYAKTSDIEAIYAKQEKLTEVSDKVTEVSGKVATLEASNTTLLGDVATLKTTVEGIDTTYATKTELGAKVNSTDLADVATSGDYDDLTNKPDLFDGNYNSLTNKPTIPTTVAELTDKGDYALKTDIENLSYNDLNDKPTIFSGSYNDLNDKPTIPSVDGLVDEQTLQNGLSLKADKTEVEPIKTLLGEETLTTTSQTVTGGVNELKEKTEYVGKNTRKFNPKYCFSCFWGETTDTSGGSWTASIEKMTKDVNACKDANVDGFILIVHIGYNATTNNFYIVEDLDVLQNGIDLMKENHIQPKAIKLHAQKYSSTDITTFGEENFKTTWKNFITQIGEKFADCGFEYLTVHNEVKYIYNNSTYTDFVLECFELARNMGYKTGITNAGFEEACHGTISEILDNADAIFVNHYQPITNKGSKIQKQLSVDAWEYSFCMNYIDHLYCKYDKPIIISESGVQDYWCALAQPSKYSWSETQETNGEAPYVYLYGAFEVLNSSPIAELWGWYDIDYPIVKNLIKYYMGGIYNE